MRKFLAAIALTLLLPTGITLNEKDKDKEKEGDKHKPILIFTWETAWNPIIRAISMEEAIVPVISETECE